MQARFIAVTLFCCYLTLSSVGTAFGAEVEKQAQSKRQYQIVFSTFDKSSAERYAYLRDSVQAMLAGRLAAKDRVKVLEKTFSEEELLALKKKGSHKGCRLANENADYLVTGALFSLTSGLEVQVELYPLVPDEEILPFFSSFTRRLIPLLPMLIDCLRRLRQGAFGYPASLSGKEGKDR